MWVLREFHLSRTRGSCYTLLLFSFAIDISVLTSLKVWLLVFHYLYFTLVDVDVFSLVRCLIIFACFVILSWDRRGFVICDSTILTLFLMILILLS